MGHGHLVLIYVVLSLPVVSIRTFQEKWDDDDNDDDDVWSKCCFYDNLKIEM